MTDFYEDIKIKEIEVPCDCKGPTCRNCQLQQSRRISDITVEGLFDQSGSTHSIDGSHNTNRTARTAALSKASGSINLFRTIGESLDEDESSHDHPEKLHHRIWSDAEAVFEPFVPDAPLRQPTRLASVDPTPLRLPTRVPSVDPDKITADAPLAMPRRISSQSVHDGPNFHDCPIAVPFRQPSTTT